MTRITSLCFSLAGSCLALSAADTVTLQRTSYSLSGSWAGAAITPLQAATTDNLFSQWTARTFQSGNLKVQIKAIGMADMPAQMSATYYSDVKVVTPVNSADGTVALAVTGTITAPQDGSMHDFFAYLFLGYPCGQTKNYSTASDGPWPGSMDISLSASCYTGYETSISTGTAAFCGAFGASIDYLAGSYELDLRACANYVMAPGTVVTGTLAVDHIEVVQVIQDPANGVPLVKGKSAVARVFLREDGNNLTGSIFDVTGTLIAGDPSLKGMPIALNSGSAVARPAAVLAQNPSEDNEDQSLNFLLPVEWTQTDQLNLTATATGAGATKTGTLSASFADYWPKPFKIAYLLVCTPDLSGKMLCPSINGMEDVPVDLRKRYPVADDGVSYTYLGSIPWKGQLGSNIWLGNRVELAKFTLALLKIYLLTNPGADQLIAWLPYPAGIPASLSEVVHYGFDHIWWAVYLDPRDSGNDIAQGFALNLGLPWVTSPGPIGLSGFDPLARQLIPSTMTGMVGLSALLPWISKLEYTALMDTGGAPPAAPATPSAAAPSSPAAALAAPRASGPLGASQPYLVASGSVSAAGTGQLDSAYQVTGGAAPRASDPSGSYCLRFTLSAGSPVDYCFTPQPFGDQPLDPLPFVVKAPYPSGTTSVSLRHAGADLAVLNAASAAPALTINSPRAGDSWSGSGTLSWSGSDPGGKALTYSVFYSPDNGSTWSPLEIDTQDTQYNVDCTQINGGKQVWFRVMATSRLSTTTVDAGPMTVVQQPKVVLPATTVDFGTVKVGMTADRNVALNNTGSGPVLVDAAITAGTAFLLPSASQGIVLLAGGTRQIPVRFAPAATGPQTGTLTLTVHDASNTTLTVGLTGAAIANTGPTFAASAASLQFGSVTVGQYLDQTITLQNAGTATLTISSITPPSGGFTLTAPAAPFSIAPEGTQTLTVRFAPAAAGAASSSIQLATNDPTNASVTIQLSGQGVGAGTVQPSFAASAVVNGASFKAPLTRCELASVFGTNLATSTAPATSLPLPASLGGAQVTVGGLAAPLVWVSPTQVNFQVPCELPLSGAVSIALTSAGSTSQAQSVTLAPYAPGVFTYASASGLTLPIAVHLDASLVTPDKPAQPNEYLVVYATGVGNLDHLPVTGTGAPSSPLSAAVDKPTVTVGGVATSVGWVGLTPGFVGLVQITIQLPATLPPGPTQPLVVSFAGAASPPVNLPVPGVAAVPQITLSASSLDFGTVTTGQTKNLLITISNTGSAALNVSGVTASNSAFSWVSPATPFSVAAGGQAAATVRFTAPSTAGGQTGTLTIASNDPTRPSVQVSLTATAAAASGSNVNIVGITLEAGVYSGGAFSPNGARWSTVAGDGAWVLGISQAGNPNNPLLNAADKSVNIPAGTYYTYNLPPATFDTAVRVTIRWSDSSTHTDTAIFAVGSLTTAAQWTWLSGATNIAWASTGLTGVTKVTQTLTPSTSPDDVFQLGVQASAATGSGP